MGYVPSVDISNIESLIKLEGRDINVVPSSNFQEINSKGIYAGNIGSTFNSTYNVSSGRCIWIESITWGTGSKDLNGRFQALIKPFPAWGLDAGVDENTGENFGEIWQQGGSGGTIIVRRIVRELAQIQLGFTGPQYTGPTRFFASINGVDFTDHSGLRFQARKVLLWLGASTSWDLLRNFRANVDAYRYKSALIGAERTYMEPDQGDFVGDSVPFSGRYLAANRLVEYLNENGEDFRLVNKSFGGSNFIKNWWGALQSGYIDGVNYDMIVIEAGANDSKLEWTNDRRRWYKDRLAKFIDHRNKFRKDAPVIIISPVLLDFDPSTQNWCYKDSGVNGEYDGVPMTRIEIGRKLTEEVATSPLYGGGTVNNVYYINGLEADFDPDTQVVFRNDGGDGWSAQSGLRRATYFRDTSGPLGYVGEIAYDSGYGVGVDTQDLNFSWRSDTLGNEQVAGKRVHRSPMGHETLMRYIVKCLKEFGLIPSTYSAP